MEGRGVKDPEALKRKQLKREEIEKKAENTAGGESGGLRVSFSLSLIESFGSSVCRALDL